MKRKAPKKPRLREFVVYLHNLTDRRKAAALKNASKA